MGLVTSETSIEFLLPLRRLIGLASGKMLLGLSRTPGTSRKGAVDDFLDLFCLAPIPSSENNAKTKSI